MSTGQSHPEKLEGVIRVEEVELPGVGLRHDFVTHKGRRVGVISHRSGRRELLVYDPRDPDACSEAVLLSIEEADTLSELLGAPRILERLAALHEQVASLVSEQLTVEKGSPFEGRTLGDTQARTLTGASIVAVLRGGEVIASPGPDFRFEPGDGVVVVGTRDGVEGVAQILGG
jgi:TrkA domain protein